MTSRCDMFFQRINQTSGEKIPLKLLLFRKKCAKMSKWGINAQLSGRQVRKNTKQSLKNIIFSGQQVAKIAWGQRQVGVTCFSKGSIKRLAKKHQNYHFGVLGTPKHQRGTPKHQNPHFGVLGTPKWGFGVLV